MMQDDAATVKQLLDAAGLTVSDEEFIGFTKTYPVLRAQADSLYLPELEFIDPVLSFDPRAE